MRGRYGSGREQGARMPALQYAAGALILYGLIGLLVNLRLVALLWAGATGWFGLPPASDGATLPAFLEPLRAHYDARPWLPWGAWLVGAGLLLWARWSTPAKEEGSELAASRLPGWVAPAVLLAVLLVAGFGRMALLLPQDAGISEQPYDDEGVYAGASQLFLQGIMPYRDYFFAHPPVAAFSYAPAMAYHFNEWGSPTSFLVARSLSVGYSLLTLAFLFAIGLRLAGLAGGTVAGLLWALDGRVVEINRKVMLDVPMVLLACAALLLYLWARPILLLGGPDRAPKQVLLLLFLSGACAAMSALTKITGVACLLALLVDIGGLWVLQRKAPGRGGGKSAAVAGLLSLLGGAALAGLVALGPFVLMAPSQIVRDVFFFQLLRPGDGIVEVPARVADLSSNLRNPLTLVFAVLGTAVLSGRVWLRREVGMWWPVLLWTFFSVVLLTYSRSFYQHYYIQLAAPLCLLGAGVVLLPALGRKLLPVGGLRRMRAYVVAAGLLLFVALPLIAVQWQGIITRRPDRMFELVGRYVNDAIPPGAPALSTDEQFNLLAARPPSRNSTGYLVDSYGHMISLGLGLNTRSWGDLWAAALAGKRVPPAQGERSDVYGVMWRDAPQADFLDRAARVPLIVLHSTGFNRLTPATQAAIAAESQLVEEQAKYSIYRVKPSARK